MKSAFVFGPDSVRLTMESRQGEKFIFAESSAKNNKKDLNFAQEVQ